MRLIFVTGVFILMVSSTFAQSAKLQKADNYYAKVAFAEAAKLYKGLIGSKVDSPELKAKLADCYYQMGESQSAEEVYAQVIASGDYKSESVYKYAQTLKENGKYAESDKWMTTFYSLDNADIRANEFVSNKSYIERIEAQGPYYEINPLAVNSESAEFGGYPFGTDKVYFVTNRYQRFGTDRSHTFNSKRFLDLYIADVADTKQFENPSFKSGRVNKKFHEGPLSFTSDLKTVYFTRNNMSAGKLRRDDQGIQNLKIYIADVDEEGKWSNERELGINSRDYSVGHPSVSADGKYLYFASDMPGGFGGADIYKVEIKVDGTLGEPINLGEKVNTEGQEMFPWITNEGLLFLASDGHTGLGGLDIFVVIPKKDGSFNKLINVGRPVNSSKDDFALVMNADNLAGYVSSNRTSGKGDDDIYALKLLKPFKVNLSLIGLVKDKNSEALLPGAKVDLLDESGSLVASVISDNNGNYEFGLERNMDYSITVSKDDYFDNSVVTSTKNLPDGTEEIKMDLNLEKDPGLSFYVLITDSKTKSPLGDVTIQLVNNMTGKSASYTTNAKGDMIKPLADKKLNDRGSYNFVLSKDGYIPKTVTYNVVFDKEGQYDVHSAIDLSMDPVVADLRDLIEINPISFDLGKWNIRPDAKVELDKIVEVMNKYPGMVVELGSHTDCRASKTFNMRLSDKRAKSSAAYIKSKITDPERIYGKGYGESRLLNGCECEGAVKSNCSEEEHEKNRRTEFKVISIGDNKSDVINNSDDSFRD